MPSWRISNELEEALWAAAKLQLPERATRRKSLVPAIARRSALYTIERDELEREPSRGDSADLAARALFFTLADAAKVKIPIAELVSSGGLPASRRLRVLDVGAGCGAMTLGLSDALSSAELDVLALDRDADALRLFSNAVKHLGRPSLAVETRAGNLLGKLIGDAAAADLILCGSVLNEMDEAKAFGLVTKLLEKLTADGSLIIIEPALRDSSRRLHRLRDRLIEERLGNIFAPCTRSAAPCPALALERDWCHEDRAFEATPRLAALTNATGMRAHRLKFAYLVVTRRDLALSPGPSLLRIVSSLKKSKGKSELHVCGDDGWQKLRLQKRDRTDRNREFERAQRGQLLEVGDGSYTVHDPAAS